MPSVLGVDAAWSDSEPSGVALIRTRSDGCWECVELAPSYDSFIGIADGNDFQWIGGKIQGSRPDPKCLLGAAERLLDHERVSIVSVDMPLSSEPITGRRKADNAISRKFGGKGCGTHSPSSARPGKISDQLRKSLASLGYRHAVSEPTTDTVIEAYPHPALLHLLDRDYRVPYKVGKTRKYWPECTLRQRADLLIKEFRSIYNGLTDIVQCIPDFLPQSPYEGTLTSLKRYEDTLDALVCAWVGSKYVEGCADYFGDDVAAIWVPNKRS